jgi:hypothetical protein
MIEVVNFIDDEALSERATHVVFEPLTDDPFAGTVGIMDRSWLLKCGCLDSRVTEIFKDEHMIVSAVSAIGEHLSTCPMAVARVIETVLLIRLGVKSRGGDMKLVLSWRNVLPVKFMVMFSTVMVNQDCNSKADDNIFLDSFTID